MEGEAVHPRWRGEHTSPVIRLVEGHGSSPLARGTRPSAAHFRCRARFIPAGAGNTRNCDIYYNTHSVHPRWRGEHILVQNPKTQSRGSSPLARGTLHPWHCCYSYVRFIPAGAGNTACSLCRRTRHAVHPRWRGEHTRFGFKAASPYGSSPLARGTHAVR